MIRKHKFSSKRGTILILGLWALTFLTVLSVNMALGVRQKMIMVSRIEKRAKLQVLVSSAIKMAIAINQTDTLAEDTIWTGTNKKIRYNNPRLFRKIKLNEGESSISYLNFDDSFVRPRVMYGFMDEERLININSANEEVLQRLIFYTVGLDEEDSLRIASAIVDWREHSDKQVVGFYQDTHYANLKDSYQQKKEVFENIDELLLVKGINQKIYDRLKNFVTVYGLGQVNINTATKASLVALGLPELTAHKVIWFRRGKDGLDSTDDDYMFPTSGGIFSRLIASGQFDAAEIQLLIEVQLSGMTGSQSLFYRASASGNLESSKETKRITCVFLAKNGKIVYWKQ